MMFTKWIASMIGAPEPAFRLLFSILLVYPMAWFYRSKIINTSIKVQHVYFVLSGLFLGIFNFGFQIYHTLIAITFTYLSILVLGPSKNTVLLNFIFHMTYLTVGYIITSTDTYDIKWTMPHCVLTLRLIGLCFDLWDGSKPADKISASNKLTCLKNTPSLLEIASHVFFPACFLVGPQFSMRRLLDFTNKKYDMKHDPTPLAAGIQRAAYGLAYLAIYQFGTLYFPDDYFLSENFTNSSIWTKHAVIGIWGKITLWKYISCWLLTEGACITFGIAFNGVNKETGKSEWNGCRNVDILIFEGCTKFGHYIESFNINTNHWAAQYIYKRCAFLGSKVYSQVVTLLFLALWHGINSGYYMTFFMEFAIMLMEKDLENIILRSKLYSTWCNNPIFKVLAFVVCKAYSVIFMGFCLVPFTQMAFSRWWAVYRSVYFSGFILFFPWMILYKPVVKAILKPIKVNEKSK